MRRLAFISTCLLIAAATLAGQTGVVKSGGQPIPGATVTATAGNKKSTTTTDEAGRYEFSDLAPGSYTFEVRMFGFETAKKEAALGTPVDFTIELAKPPATQARRVQGFQNLEQNQAESQAENESTRGAEAAGPQAGGTEANPAVFLTGSMDQGVQRNPDDGGPRAGGGFGGPGGFGQGGAQTAGGAFGTPGAGGGAPGAGGGGGFGGGGGGRGGGGFGGGGFGGGRGGPRAGARNGAPAGFIGNRRNRGRDGLHGSAFLSAENSALDARQYSLNGASVPQSAYAKERFGLTLGGPLKIPKIWNSDQTFFFLNYTGTRGKNPFKGVAIMPTEAERMGDFSAINSIIVDPTTNQPFPGNIIPANRLNPVALGLQSFIPLPNQPGLAQNYSLTTSYKSVTDTLNLRLNQNITKKDRVALNFSFQRRDSDPVQLYGWRDSQTGTGVNTDFSYTRNLTPRTLSVAHATFNRNRTESDPYFSYLTNVAAELGIQGTSQAPINWGPPNLSFTNFGGLSDSSPSRVVNNTFGLNDTISHTHGKHNLSAGVFFTRTQLNVETDSNGRGTFTFTGLQTSEFDSAGIPLAGTGYDYADFLLSLPQSSSVRYGSSNSYFREKNMSIYGQDDIRLRSNLTINVGLRWEYYGPFSELYGHIANLAVAPYFTAASVVTPGSIAPYGGGHAADSLVNPDKNNFAPRVAIAYKPLKSLMIRTGYGIYYNGSIYSGIARNLASQPPFADTANLTTSPLDPLTIEQGFTLLPTKTITNTYAIDPNYRIGYAQSWNFTVQNEFSHGIVAEVGYLGTKGTRLDLETAPNAAAPGSALTAEQRLAIANATSFTFDSSNGDSIYHALNARLTRRFRRGISLNGTYTFAKAIDNSSTFGGAGNTVAENYLDLKAERGLSSFNRAQVFNVNSVISSPRTENKFLKNWTFTWSLVAETGTPLTARVLGNLADSSGTGVVGASRAEATGLPISGGQFFNLAAFTTPPAGAYGNAARNTIPGPGMFSMNASAQRSFSLSERKRIEFIVTANNVLNNVNFTNIGTVVNAANYGLVTAAGAMRTITAQVRFRF
ncbi:MAG TPA: TonB-dependent receptor [Bryobacteraceae bacterium]|jgi:hypothetical protein